MTECDKTIAEINKSIKYLGAHMKEIFKDIENGSNSIILSMEKVKIYTSKMRNMMDRLKEYFEIL